MCLFGLFKKKEARPEIVLFEDMPKFLKEKKAEITNQTLDPKNQVMELVIGLVADIEEQIEDLKEIDLEKKNIQGRARQIVENNLNNYIEYLNQLIKSLNQLNKERFQDLSADINNIFADFESRSNVSFQKATYVIGKELENIRGSLVRFFKKFNELTEENRPLIRKYQVMESLEKYTKEMEEEAKAQADIDKQIKENKKSIADLETETESINKKIEETKKSSAYLKNIENQKRLEHLEKEIEQKTKKLKSQVDFKLLAKTFHTNKREMKWIQDYKSDFMEAFQKDKNGQLEKLIKESGDNSKRITESMKSAKRLLSDKSKISIKEDATIEMIEEIKNNEIKKKEFDSDIKEKVKVKEKIDKVLNEIKNKLKKEAIIIGIQVE